MKSCKQLAARFSEKYGNTPGIIRIEGDGFLGEFILVFVDNLKFKTELPSTFDDVKVSIYDVRSTLYASSKFLSMAKRSKMNLSIPQNKASFEYFSRTAELCFEMLK